MRALKKLTATAGMAAALAGSVAIAAPAEAAYVKTYVVASTTFNGCRTAVAGDVRDLRAQGIYKTHTTCVRVSNYRWPYQARVSYYVR